MTSLWLMKGLLALYFVLMCVAVGDGRFVLALYWFGALVLNISVYLFAMR